MNLDELTLGQLKELQSHAFSQEAGSRQPHPYVGKYVIVRCKDAGVHAGRLVAAQGREATLEESRRLWYWKPNGEDFLSGVARTGLKSDSRVGGPIPIHLTETCEIIACTGEAEDSIKGASIYVPTK